MEKHVLYLMLRVMQWLDVRLAQLDRAFGYGPKGRGFESSNARSMCHVCVPGVRSTLRCGRCNAEVGAMPRFVS